MRTNIIGWAGTLGRRLLARQFRATDPLLNDKYVSGPPSPQQAVDLFAGTWASRIPIADVRSGTVPLFEDGRIAWLIERVGGTEGLSILELGPLEGAHTTMLERAGAASIHAIDANTLAYMKCLVVKELLQLKAHFELGDFDDYLKACSDRYDLIVACGVLYHLTDPLRTLLDIARLTDRIFIWSHFFDESAMPEGDSRRAMMTGETRRRTLDGETLTYHMRTYGGTHHPLNFCGGTSTLSVWLERDDVTELLTRRGYKVETAFLEPDHPHGPAACIYAERK